MVVWTYGYEQGSLSLRTRMAAGGGWTINRSRRSTLLDACMHTCMPARVRTFLQRLRGQDVPEAARVLAHEERHEARGEPADRVEVREAQVCRARGQRGPREGADLFYYLFFIFIFFFFWVGGLMCVCVGGESIRVLC